MTRSTTPPTADRHMIKKDRNVVILYVQHSLAALRYGAVSGMLPCPNAFILIKCIIRSVGKATSTPQAIKVSKLANKPIAFAMKKQFLDTIKRVLNFSTASEGECKIKRTEVRVRDILDEMHGYNSLSSCS